MRHRSSALSPVRGLRSLPALVAIAAVMVIAACSTTTSTNTGQVDLILPQRLATVNDSNVPYAEVFTVFDGGITKSDSQVFSSGLVSYNGDGTFTLSYTVRNKLFLGSQIFGDATVTVSWQGTWSLAGKTLTLSYTLGGVAQTATGTAGAGVSVINLASTIQSSATQTTVVTHKLGYAAP